MASKTLQMFVAVALLLGVVAPSAVAEGCRFAPAGAGQREDRITLVGPIEIPRRAAVNTVVSVDGDVRLDGVACGDVIVISGSARIDGAVDGDVIDFSNEAAVIGRRARVTGDVVYVSKRPVVERGAAVGGEVREFDGTEISNEITSAILVFSLILIVGSALSALAAGMLGVWLAPRAADAVMGPARGAIAPCVGMGLAVAIGFPIVSVIALVTVIGIPLGVVMLLALFPLYAIGGIAGAWILGRLIYTEPRSRYVAFLIGWAILTALSFVPIVGAMTAFAAGVYGLGALTVALWRARRTGQTPPAQAVTAPAPQAPIPPPPGV